MMSFQKTRYNLVQIPLSVLKGSLIQNEKLQLCKKK